MGVASIAVKGGATAMKVAKGAMYVARAADLASNAYAFCVGAHDTAEQIKTIQQKLYNGESVSADEYGRMALSAICTVISGVSTAASLKGFGTVDDDLALLASKYKKVAPEIDNPTTTKMTGGVDKTPDVEIKSKSSEPSMEYNLQLFAKKADDVSLNKNTTKYYQVTSYENAHALINSSNPSLKGREFKEVYVWTEQPTLKQAQNSGAYYLDTVIEFETNASFSRDTSIQDSSLWNIARVSDRPGPISISNVKEVGFKNSKRWWQFWKE